MEGWESGCGESFGVQSGGDAERRGRERDAVSQNRAARGGVGDAAAAQLSCDDAAGG